MSPVTTSFRTASAKRRFACRYASQSVSSKVISPGWSDRRENRRELSVRVQRRAGRRRTVKEGPEDRVRESIVVAFGDFGGEVDGDAGELVGESFRDEFSVDFGDVETCNRKTSLSTLLDLCGLRLPGQPIQVKSLRGSLR